MTSTSVYSTSSSDRCEAKNKLTCRVHGVAGDFAEVPAAVEESIDRYRSLREQAADAKASLKAYAEDLGIKYADIGYVTHGVSTSVTVDGKPRELTADQIEGLKNLEQEYDEASVEQDDESDYQAKAALDYVNDAIKQEFPDASARERTNLSYLVGLRFFGVENENFGSSSDSEYFKYLGADESTRGYVGPTREELFAPLAVPQNRAKLRKIDRGYFTALSGRIPSDEQLSEVSHQRQLRRVSPTRDYMMDETFTLVSDLASID